MARRRLQAKKQGVSLIDAKTIKKLNDKLHVFKEK